MTEFLNSIITNWPEWSPRLFKAMGNTAFISVIGFVFASVLGTVLALSLDARIAALRRAAQAYVNFFRGIPLLVVLFLIYFGLPGVGVVLDAIPTAIIGGGQAVAD